MILKATKKECHLLNLIMTHLVRQHNFHTFCRPYMPRFLWSASWIDCQRTLCMYAYFPFDKEAWHIHLSKYLIQISICLVTLNLSNRTNSIKGGEDFDRRDGHGMVSLSPLRVEGPRFDQLLVLPECCCCCFLVDNRCADVRGFRGCQAHSQWPNFDDVDIVEINMVDCGNARCAQDRRVLKKELLTWTKKVPILVGKYFPMFWSVRVYFFLVCSLLFSPFLPFDIVVKFCVPISPLYKAFILPGFCVCIRCIHCVTLLFPILWKHMSQNEECPYLVWTGKRTTKDGIQNINFHNYWILIVWQLGLSVLMCCAVSRAGSNLYCQNQSPAIKVWRFRALIIAMLLYSIR